MIEQRVFGWSLVFALLAACRSAPVAERTDRSESAAVVVEEVPCYDPSVVGTVECTYSTQATALTTVDAVTGAQCIATPNSTFVTLVCNVMLKKVVGADKPMLDAGVTAACSGTNQFTRYSCGVWEQVIGRSYTYFVEIPDGCPDPATESEAVLDLCDSYVTNELRTGPDPLLVPGYSVDVPVTCCNSVAIAPPPRPVDGTVSGG
jgi:hypothetical protein